MLKYLEMQLSILKIQNINECWIKRIQISDWGLRNIRKRCWILDSRFWIVEITTLRDVKHKILGSG